MRWRDRKTNNIKQIKLEKSQRQIKDSKLEQIGPIITIEIPNGRKKQYQAHTK